jgi:hypothetical protein
MFKKTQMNPFIKSIIILQIIFFGLVKMAIAQHCHYDHSALIGIRPINQNNEIIEGLKITFVDENGKSIIVRKDLYKGDDKYIGFVNDTAIFWRNPKFNKDITHKKRNEESRHFIQAATDYIFITNSKGRMEKGRYVKIEDIDGAANGGYFSSKMVYVKPEQVQGLCGYPNGHNFLEQYQTVIITLEKANPRVNNKNIKFWNGFRMEFDRSPLVNCPECDGCYCELLQVFNPNDSIIYEEVLMRNDLHDSNDNKIDSVQFEDYNFDEYPDLRFFYTRFIYQTILVYEKTTKKYQTEPLLSRMIGLNVDKKNNILQGVIIDSEPHVQPNKIMKNLGNYENIYQMRGRNLTEVRIISSYFFNPWNGYSIKPNDSIGNTRDRKDTAYFNYHNYQLLRQNKSSDKTVYQISKTTMNFKFELSIHELKAKDNSALDQYFREIKAYNIKSGKLTYIDKVYANKRNSFIDSLEVEDYNFDGFSDIKICDSNFPCSYMVYNLDNDTFVNDPLLSKLEDIEFNFKSKTLIGDLLVFDKKDKNLSGMYPNNDYLKSQSRYFVFGSGIQYVKELNKEYLHTKDGLRAEEKINYYKYEKQTLTPIKEAEYKIQENAINNNLITVMHGTFKFVLEKNTPGIAIPSEKGYYANKISVYNQKDNKLIYSIVAVGNKLKESEGCGDSLQIADYNFDGYTDFRVCNNSMSGKHIYYIYHQKRNTFLIENTLTELYGLNFDFENKTAKGSTDRKEYQGYPWDSPYQYYMETLLFEGVKLENLTVTTTVYGGSSYISAKCKYINQKRIYQGDTIGLLLQRKNLLIKEVGPFKFEMEFNPEEYKTSGEKGAYVKVLNIFSRDRKVGRFEMHGNYLKEVPHWLDSMEIADFNFDGYPDIRMYSSLLANGRHVYMLYNPDKEVQVFYQDPYFSLLMDAEFIPKQKIMKGKILEANQTIYFFLKNDTLTLTTQDKDLSKQPFIEESIYKNGNRKTLRAAYSKLEPEIKKEYGDYNFDGYEDFRQQSKKSPYYYDAFIYNTAKETFEKDTLLSKFEVFNYNKPEKTLDGSFRIRENETTWQTKYYQWSFMEKKIVLYQEKVCFSKFPMSESYKCVISKLVNGKWINTEIFGAE